MKRKSARKERDSMRTLYIYAGVVIFLISVSFTVRLFTLFLQSKFDGHEHFAIAVTQDATVKEIVTFSPQIPALSVLEIKDPKPVMYPQLAKEYGITTDARLDVKSAIEVTNDAGVLLWNATTNYASIQTDMTIVDLVRLVLISHDIVSNNKLISEINLSGINPDNNTLIARVMNDPSITQENVSVQIINASDGSGMGQRLGRVLTNLGANVVDVTTAHKSTKLSVIQYFGEETYTLQRIKARLGYQTKQLQKQTIANIVIILGEDSLKTEKF